MTGRAQLWYHAGRPRHFSVGIEHDATSLATHVTLPIAGRSFIVQWGLCGRLFFGRRTHEISFPMPRAREAYEFQKSHLGRPVLFDGYTANCLTWCLDVLRLGGLEVPERFEAAPAWLARYLRAAGTWNERTAYDLKSLGAYIRWSRRKYEARIAAGESRASSGPWERATFPGTGWMRQ